MRAIPNEKIIGRRFGRLIGLKQARNRAFRKFFLFKCDCGLDKEISLQSVINGKTRSCGCLQREMMVARRSALKHGECHKTPEHRSWQAMLSRCSYKAHHAYKNYGGRGIKVCERWKKYENFLADMGRRPSLNHTLDRYPNNDGDYEPGNCRWATKKEQIRNSRANHLINYRGQILCLTEAVERFGIKYGIGKELLRYRILRGWSVERALETKPSTLFRRK